MQIDDDIEKRETNLKKRQEDIENREAAVNERLKNQDKLNIQIQTDIANRILGFSKTEDKMTFYASLSAWSAVAGAVLVLIGTGLLLWTLYLTRQANQAAQEAVKVTKDIGRIQTIAYMGLDEIKTVPYVNDKKDESKGILVKSRIKNSGNSPSVCKSLYVKIVDYSGEELNKNLKPSYEFNELEDSLMCGAGSTIWPQDAPIDLDLLEKCHKKERRVFHLLYCRYRDVFWSDGDNEHVVTACTEIFINLPPQEYDSYLAGLPDGAVTFLNHPNHFIGPK